MPIRGLRGAISVEKNSKKDIIEATKKLLKKLLTENNVKTKDIASITFSSTKDLSAEFPAVAARKIGLNYTPLLCTNEINVPKSEKKVIRILMHINSKLEQNKIKNIYIGRAIKLRPDINK